MISSVINRMHLNLRRTSQVYMILIALVIGILGGLFAVGFREFIRLGQLAAWWNGGDLVDHIRSLPWWWKIIVPSTGGLIVGLITFYFAREAKGHGVPEVMEAIALKDGRIRPRIVIAKMIASGLSIASGGSVGREGPIVQIGSSLGSTAGQWLKVNRRRMRTLVGCGAAAGIAATFNAPVAGALFAVEIILGDFGVSQFSPIVVSSVSATVVGQYFLGDIPAFKIPAYSLINPVELLFYAALGILAGIVAIGFVKSLYSIEDVFERLRIYPPLKTVIGGGLIGIMALEFPQVLGVGYETISEALHGNMILSLLLVLVFAKIFAVSITLGSGGSGGIFAPSLFIGAMTGGAIGILVNNLWPGVFANSGAYALVGMGAVVGAATKAPITAIIIIFELTNDYEIILPLMISCIIATVLSTRFMKGSIYSIKLLRRGIDIHRGRSIDVMKDFKVRMVMKQDFVTIPVNEGLMSVVSRFIDHQGNTLYVVDENKNLAGIITLDDIRPVIPEISSLNSLLIAKDLMVKNNIPKFHPDDNLTDVMKHLGRHNYDAPVVSNGKIVGCIWPEDVIKLYNAEIFRRDTAEGFLSNIDGETMPIDLPGSKNIKLAEIQVTPELVGKRLGELDIRKRFGVTIILLKRKIEDKTHLVDTVPAADTILEETDVLLALGPESGLRAIENI